MFFAKTTIYQFLKRWHPDHSFRKGFTEINQNELDRQVNQIQLAPDITTVQQSVKQNFPDDVYKYANKELLYDEKN
jgi:hypothetical protein